jgi:subfamily B ATP-binding cassette protein MsbA
MALIPMLDVLFQQTKPVLNKPSWQGIKEVKSFMSDFLNYNLNQIISEYGQSRALMYMVGLIIALFLMKNFFNYAAMYFITFMRNGVLRDLRDALYKKVVELPISFFSEKRKGDIMARISSDVLEIQHSFLSILELIVKEPLTIIFTLLGMLFISVKLTFFVILFIPISGLLISIIGKKLKKHSERAQKEQGYFLSLIEETLGGLKVIKAFNSEPLFNAKFQESTGRFYSISNRLLHRQNLASPLSEFLGIMTIAVLLWYGGRLVLLEKVLEPSLFITYLGLAYNILTPAKAISKGFYSVKKGDAAAERVLEVLEAQDIMEDRPNAVEKTTFDKEITYENVSFKYEDQWVLKNFNLTIPKGKSVALVGQSGSGKSTIAALLSRFYDVNEGAIKIDGIDVRDIKKHAVRGLMGLVTQDAILFNDSVGNNIIFGKDIDDKNELENAAKVANAHDFIVQMPQGYETNIGDAGSKLSGGQKQRLSIARAVLKNPPIMILDEATSALDTESERLVQDALEHMMENRTSLVIAHRLSTVQKADLIVVMQEGEIIEQGTHNELIAKNGTYKKLVELQEI